MASVAAESPGQRSPWLWAAGSVKDHEQRNAASNHIVRLRTLPIRSTGGVAPTLRLRPEDRPGGRRDPCSRPAVPSYRGCRRTATSDFDPSTDHGLDRDTVRPSRSRDEVESEQFQDGCGGLSRRCRSGRKQPVMGRPHRDGSRAEQDAGVGRQDAPDSAVPVTRIARTTRSSVGGARREGLEPRSHERRSAKPRTAPASTPIDIASAAKTQAC